MAGKKAPRTKAKKPEPALGASSRTGRIYDPCRRSGGMFVSSEKFIEAQQGKIGDISIYGQESNDTTWRRSTASRRRSSIRR